jgi:hypothetical protein
MILQKLQLNTEHVFQINSLFMSTLGMLQLLGSIVYTAAPWHWVKGMTLRRNHLLKQKSLVLFIVRLIYQKIQF